MATIAIVGGPIKAIDIGGNKRRLLADYECEIDGVKYVIPAGFEWDGASIPRIGWSYYGHPFDAVHLEPGLWHDAAYAGLFENCPRDYADSIYRRWIMANGQPVFRAWKEWLAIRIFGGSHWDAALVIGSLVIIPIALSGCATKTRNIDLDGLYASETGTLAIGSVEIQAAPLGEESVSIKYSEDNAWLQPSMKTHEIKILMTGTNSVERAAEIVKQICGAFTSVAAPKDSEVK